MTQPRFKHDRKQTRLISPKFPISVVVKPMKLGNAVACKTPVRFQPITTAKDRVSTDFCVFVSATVVDVGDLKNCRLVVGNTHEKTSDCSGSASQDEFLSRQEIFQITEAT